MKKSFLTILFSLVFIPMFSQYGYKDGNRIGITGGVLQSTLFTSNFNAKPGIGFNGGLSVRGNYYNNWSMIFGMQFFVNNFTLDTTTESSLQKETPFSVSGVQVRLLLSYNVVKDHVSIDFGPVLQVNGKMSVKQIDELNTINGTLLRAKQIEEINKINGNIYFGVSAGNRRVRAILHYQYGVTNILNKLNDSPELKTANLNRDFKGNFGTVSGQILFNL